jgi:hypothetical protein
MTKEEFKEAIKKHGSRTRFKGGITG